MSAYAEIRQILMYGMIVILLAGVCACAPRRAGPPALPPAPQAPAPPRPMPTTPPAPIPQAPAPQAPAPPRQTASLQLSDQGRILIERKNYDDAIRILERAIALNPHNGENYYYMAEAWLGKGSAAQAGEFNRLAGMYLDSSLWGQRIEHQRRTIEGAQ